MTPDGVASPSPWSRIRFAIRAAAGVTDDLPRRLEKSVLNQSMDDAFDAFDRADRLWKEIGEAFPIADNPSASPDELLTLSLYLRRCTRPTDRIFVQHYIPQVLALAERGFAGGHAALRPGFFENEQMQFENVAEHTFDGRFPIRLLVNRDARVTGRFQPLKWPCFRP